MQIALICPTAYLEEFAVQSDIHMVLTEVALNDEKYRKFYEKEKKFKILDNSLFENGKGVSHKELLEAARAIDADEVILTDVLYKNENTLEALKECYNYFQLHGMQHEFSFMAVPQGDCAINWLECYGQICQLPFIRTIGLSKLAIPKSYSAPIAEARVNCLGQLFESSNFNKSKRYHLLGSSNEALRELEHYNRLEISKYISSMDTSAPFVYGKNKKRLNEANMEIATKLDFAQKKNLKADQLNCIAGNIRDLLGVAHDN